MLRPKKKIKVIQTFTQKSRGRDVREGKVILLTAGGVKEGEIRTDEQTKTCLLCTWRDVATERHLSVKRSFFTAEINVSNTELYQAALSVSVVRTQTTGGF